MDRDRTISRFGRSTVLLAILIMGFFSGFHVGVIFAYREDDPPPPEFVIKHCGKIVVHAPAGYISKVVNALERIQNGAPNHFEFISKYVGAIEWTNRHNYDSRLFVTPKTAAFILPEARIIYIQNESFAEGEMDMIGIIAHESVHAFLVNTRFSIIDGRDTAIAIELSCNRFASKLMKYLNVSTIDLDRVDSWLIAQLHQSIEIGTPLVRESGEVIEKDIGANFYRPADKYWLRRGGAKKIH